MQGQIFSLQECLQNHLAESEELQVEPTDPTGEAAVVVKTQVANTPVIRFYLIANGRFRAVNHVLLFPDKMFHVIVVKLVFRFVFCHVIFVILLQV